MSEDAWEGSLNKKLKNEHIYQLNREIEKLEQQLEKAAKELSLKESWVKHHQKSVETALAEKAKLKQQLEELEKGSQQLVQLNHDDKEHIAAIQESIKIYDSTIEQLKQRLEDAESKLSKISNNIFLEYGHGADNYVGESTHHYKMGVTDGHRLAKKWADEYLEKYKQEGSK